MKVGVQFYGYTIDLHPSDIADGLDADSTPEQVEAAVREALDQDMIVNRPMYVFDGGFKQLVAATTTALEAQRAERDAEEE